MTAVYKRELRSYLTSMIGYIFIFFVLLLTGIYFSAYQLSAAYPKFEYTLSALTFVFLISVPILTMRVLAEERKQKTDQLLLTAPVSVEKIVMGKYLALVTIFAIPMAIICLYPLLMTKFGTVSLGMAYTAILGFFLLGCANLAYRKPGNCGGADICLFICILYDERNLLLLFRRSAVYLHYLRTSCTGGVHHHLYHDKEFYDISRCLCGRRSGSGRTVSGEVRIFRGRYSEGSSGI